jgi:hypothetical protein
MEAPCSTAFVLDAERKEWVLGMLVSMPNFSIEDFSHPERVEGQIEASVSMSWMYAKKIV